jgi:hypothetical protein
MTDDQHELEEAHRRQLHATRFRKVSNRYPRRVAEAYDGDLVRAAAESDEQVAASVAAWERARGGSSLATGRRSA